MSEVVLTSKGRVLFTSFLEPVDIEVVLLAVISPALSDPQEMIGPDSCVLLFDLINSVLLLIHVADP